MTTRQRDYSKGKIYKIMPMDGNDEDIYIGSTTKKYLSQRFTAHRGDYKNWSNGGNSSKLMSFDIFQKYGIENCVIVLIEEVNAKSKDELLSREAYYIKLLKCVNKMIPLRTKKEYIIDTVEHIKEYNKQYLQNNKEHIKEYKASNRESINLQGKKYYAANKDMISQKAKEKR